MKLNRVGYLLGLLASGFLLVSTCVAQDLVYATNAAQAFARAKAEGKMILTEFGRPACSDCNGMRARFELLSPPLKQWILESCVLWNADIDVSSEYQPYTAGLTQYSLPLMCFVDPAVPQKFTVRYKGLIDAPLFYGYIKAQALLNLPICVTNLPGVPLNDAAFVVKGVARTNAAFRGSISNAPITAVMWRLNGAGSFQPAAGTKSWSAAVSLASGTNTFECFVQYGSQNSWTNRVLLVNNGSGTTTLPQTITFSPLPNHSYGNSPFDLASFATGGGSTSPVTFTLTGLASVSGSMLTITGAGSVTVTANQAGDATYSAAPPVSQSFTVSKALLTVTADDSSRSYAKTNPLFSASYSGFISPDTASVLKGNPSLTTTATSNSIAGSYPIVATNGTLSATNYSFTFVNGTLTINNGSRSVVNLAALTNFLGNGIVDQADLNAVLTRYWSQSPPYITNSTFPGQTNLAFNITNFSFTVQFTADLAHWTNLNSPASICFTDTNAISGGARYYRLVASTNANF